MQKWKPGDLVTVVTVNNGLPVIHKRPVENWHGVVVGPSLVGPGWWNVRRDTPSGGTNGRTICAVPDGEIRPRKR
jgi:hypothetical protein